MLLHPGWSLKAELLPLVLSTSAPREREEHLKGASAAREAQGSAEQLVGTGAFFVTSRETPSQTFQKLQSSSGHKLGCTSVEVQTARISCLGCCSAQDTAEQPERDSELILPQDQSCVGPAPSPPVMYMGK